MKFFNQKKSVVVLAFLMSGLSLMAQDGEKLFKQTCTACHSIGKGKLVGPDLKGVNQRRAEDWIVNFVKNAADFGTKDADAKAIIAEYGYPMPNQALQDAEIKAIINYIAANSPQEVVEEQAQVEEIPEIPEDPALDPANASEEDILAGVMLFSGEKRFANGGPSCITCHNVDYDDLVAGGLLAKDLTHVYDRMGAAGINGILGAPPFPAMASSYKDNPLSEKEIFQLSAFFNKAHVDNVYQHQRVYNNNLLIYGGGGAFLTILVIIYSLFLERKRKCVKEGIYKRQIKAASSK
ncbi:MAG: cytochrome c [Flavobacteriales bacterium]|nr:cytochrome c [Flavobacteriales bacterium]